MADTLINLNIDQLQPNPFQPRDKIKNEDVEELVSSIKIHGIIEPLIVANTPAGYQIIAGERRWRAAKIAGLKAVPAVVKKTSPKQMLELALIENVQRENLNAIERAKGFQQLMREFNFTIEKITERIAKSETYVRNSLRLLSLPDAIKDGVIGGIISEGHARALAGLESEAEQVRCFRKIVKEGASVRRAEQIVRQLKQENLKSLSDKVVISEKDEEVEHLEQVLRAQFHSPAEINLTRSRNHTRLIITLVGDRASTDKDLKKVINRLKR